MSGHGHQRCVRSYSQQRLPPKGLSALMLMLARAEEKDTETAVPGGTVMCRVVVQSNKI